MTTNFLKDTVERAGRTFIQAYLGAWVAMGANPDALANMDNFKIAASAVALSIAMAMGLKKVGPNKGSASVV
jgi:hypothetical protein